eukprot:NODE_1001_length_1626_cov_8.511097_g826_i0.p1 GENE.NODE_1001_length_1626_cov_8.511097_g826_i0~~NODE_1001_length_1626_cov_8.511097_g826_i0.p1  ORF type:complete len:263 (+),score=42.03 NODE_1001_length_1626_cov_8.511097_g826_i0:740-1528(+)
MHGGDVWRGRAAAYHRATGHPDFGVQDDGYLLANLETPLSALTCGWFGETSRRAMLLRLRQLMQRGRMNQANVELREFLMQDEEITSPWEQSEPYLAEWHDYHRTVALAQTSMGEHQQLLDYLMHDAPVQHNGMPLLFQEAFDAIQVWRLADGPADEEFKANLPDMTYEPPAICEAVGFRLGRSMQIQQLRQLNLPWRAYYRHYNAEAVVQGFIGGAFAQGNLYIWASTAALVKNASWRIRQVFSFNPYKVLGYFLTDWETY